MIKSADFNNSVIWILTVLSFAIVVGVAIAYEKWLYFGAALSPLIIYLCIKKTKRVTAVTPPFK